VLVPNYRGLPRGDSATVNPPLYIFAGGIPPPYRSRVSLRIVRYSAYSDGKPRYMSSYTPPFG